MLTSRRTRTTTTPGAERRRPRRLEALLMMAVERGEMRPPKHKMDGAAVPPHPLRLVLYFCADALRSAWPFLAYLAKRFGRIWNFTALGNVPLHPSIFHEAYVPMP